MTHVSLERNINFDGDTAAPTSLNSELSQAEIKEVSTFAIVDNERDAMMGILAQNLADVQDKITDPQILKEQTKRMLQNAETTITGSIETKELFRLAAVAIEQDVSRDQIHASEVPTADLMLTSLERRQLVIDSLFQSRATSVDVAIVNELGDAPEQANEIAEVKFDLYRLSLAEGNPEALAAFDALLPALETQIETERMMTRTEELEIIAYEASAPRQEVISMWTGTRAVFAMANKALQRVMEKVA